MAKRWNGKKTAKNKTSALSRRLHGEILSWSLASNPNCSWTEWRVPKGYRLWGFLVYYLEAEHSWILRSLQLVSPFFFLIAKAWRLSNAKKLLPSEGCAWLVPLCFNWVGAGPTHCLYSSQPIRVEILFVTPTGLWWISVQLQCHKHYNPLLIMSNLFDSGTQCSRATLCN